MFVIGTERLPIKVWSEPDGLEHFAGAIDQARNLANHPLAQKYVCLMPDFHVGYGMPIGGVLATKGGVIPNAVGVDIGCFVGETKVPLLNGTQRTLRELHELGETVWVYSINRQHRVVPGRARAVKTRVGAELVEVTISGGETILCTPDHQFMLRDGTWREAHDLRFNQSLMPLYRTNQPRDGYEHVQHPGGGSSLTHKLVEQYLNGTLPAGYTVHHEDHNRFNNDPDNLKRMTASKHSSHYVSARGLMQTEEFKVRRLATSRERGFYGPELPKKKRAVAVENITTYMRDRPEEFARAVAGNGEHGREYLVAYNTSEAGQAKSFEVSSRTHPCPFCDEQVKSYIGLYNHRRSAHNNHKVISVRPAMRRDDVYCLQVEEYHNFALAAGVFVHNCGMVAAKTTLRADNFSREQLQEMRLAIHARVPVGHAHHATARKHPFLSAHTEDEYAETRRTDPVISAQLQAADAQIGSLGGGNHFIELQKDEAGALWIMLHSGSRNLGKRVCDFYHGEARKLMEMFHVPLPDRDLAFLPQGIPRYEQYLSAMRFCMRFAELSREQMYQQTIAAVAEVVGADFETDLHVDTHHNFAATEHHFGENLLIHRKGAVKAEGLLTIPGSMGTASYICEGLSPRESFNTCSHGAGRLLGRKEANRQITHEQAVEAMKEVVFGVRTGDYDEMPAAYKPIDDVIAAQADLVTPRYRLMPLAVVKG